MSIKKEIVLKLGDFNIWLLFFNYRTQFLQTLKLLANATDAFEWFYNSVFTDQMIKEFQDNGKILY